jgi:prevent-host-death family protein
VENPNHRGAVAEAAITLEAVKLGVEVFKPVSEHTRYDLVFGIGPRLLRVQCKSASVNGDVISIRLVSNWHSPRGYVRTRYTADEIDLVAAHCHELDRNFLLPIELIDGQSAIQLRLAPPKNAQRASIHFASAHQLSGAIAQLGERLTGSQKVAGSSPAGSTPRGSAEPQSSPGLTEVGAHAFRSHFGWYMQRAHAGEELLITRRGRPHARLGPPHPQLSTPIEPSHAENGDACGGRIDAPGPYRSHEPTSTR